MYSAPIGQKAPSTEIQPFYPIDSLGGNLQANDDVDGALETNGFIFDKLLRQVEDEMKQQKDEGKNKDVDKTEEQEVHDKEISEIAEEEVHTVEIGKIEKELEKRDGYVGIAQTTACQNGKECKMGIARYVGHHQNVVRDENFVNVAQGFG